MAMKVIENPCEGTGKFIPEMTFAEEHGPRYIECTVCGDPRVAVNRSGHVRKHEGISPAPLIFGEADEPVHSVAEMRDSAMLLKGQLWHTYLISNDPRFKRLWQHALALETHLDRIHRDQSYGSASVQLMALQVGDVE